MIFYFSIIVLIVLLSSSVWKKGQWTDGYLSMEQTNTIKGIFTLLIFLGHTTKFIELNGIIDTSYFAIRNHLDQAVVIMYLFYSGYGMTQSFKKKSIDYLKALPYKKIIPLFINFEISVVPFVVLCFILGYKPNAMSIILSFLGWVSIGNYNWYIFDILVLYILFGLSFAFASKIQNGKAALKTGALILTILSFVMVFLLRFPGHRPIWFYNTIIVFPIGIWFSIFKEKIEKFMDNGFRFFAACAICLLVYINSFLFRDLSFLIYEIWIISATVAMLLILMKIKISSKTLSFFGKLALPMLLLQGLPFVILSNLKISDYPYLFVFISFVVSVALSVLFNKFTKLIGTTKK